MAKQILWANAITNIQQNILVSLARYKFLTSSQMLALEVGTKHYPYLWKQLVSLRDRKKPLVICNSFPNPNPKKGRVESMYFLSKEGKKQILENEFLSESEIIKMPRSKTMAYKDYFHRKFTIDFQIKLDHWANKNGKTVPFFDTYFDKTGNNRTNKNLRAKTRIDFNDEMFFIPDGAFKIDNQFYLFEMYNGKDTKRVLEQLDKHAQALTYRHTHKTYNLDPNKSYKTILLFEFLSAKNALLKRIQDEKSFDFIRPYFLVKANEELHQGEFSTWRNLNDEEKPII
jgi:hypothetical protein